MESTSNATDVITTVPGSSAYVNVLDLDTMSVFNLGHGNSDFDLDHGLATDTALRREVPAIYKYLADGSRVPISVDGSRAYWTAGFEGWVSGGQEATNSVPMQLLSMPKQEEKDLLLLYPKAKVITNYITTEQYIIVVKRFLFQFKVSGNCMVAVDHPQAYARLLRRLSRELRAVSTGGFKVNCLSDPADYDTCLGEMINDIEMTWRGGGETRKEVEETWGGDGCVYVSSGIDNYVGCLVAVATELSSCRGG